MPRLDAFLGAAPRRLRWAVELREPSWLADQVYACLRDHGAALWFHHSWPSRPPDVHRFVDQPFDTGGHVLGAVAAPVAETHERLAPLVTDAVVEEVVALVPDEWLEPTSSLPDPDAVRAAYVEHLTLRLAHPAAWTGGTS